ncbi:Pseudouridine synthase, related, related [Eimeria necatrix]|uniref:Pseudouridine synthase, related, related n=1 Tax=Eimeria necatrix TaxID=51315 RepID=U6MJP0_9EIME|nr:Pseudouridine synthase, related, related [Eimeria necatrix]CDJ64231.1 Pseudouridine synthase, related, related [Eimeria necatrix]
MAIARALQLRRTRLEWLARRLALSGCLSRHEALEAIKRGNVQVDGQTVTRDVQICDEAEISYLGRTLPAAAARPALFGMIKPPRVACTYTTNGPGPTLKTLLAQCPSVPEFPLREIKKYESELMQQRLRERERLKKGNWTERREARGRQESGTSNFLEESDLRSLEEEADDGSSSKKGSSSSNSSSPLHIPGHLIPVNHLPLQAEGLVLLTNDGEFAHALRSPANKIVTVGRSSCRVAWQHLGVFLFCFAELFFSF